MLLRQALAGLALAATGSGADGLRMSISTRVEDLYLRPAYALEKFVASRSIPAVNTRQNGQHRWRFEDPEVMANVGGRLDHSKWTQVLQEHVNDQGSVDYQGMAGDPAFEQYLAEIAAVDAHSLAPLQQLALYLNAYNALCASLIVQNKPTHSILDLSTKETQVWDAPAGILAGQVVSLNDIEHRLLRFRWDEPSIHACIVCASKSCPNLRNIAFEGDSTLPEVMRKSMGDFLANEEKGLSINREENKVTLSRILLWFEDDFSGRHGGPLGFAAKSAPDSIPAMLGTLCNPTIRYFKYNWSLNSG